MRPISHHITPLVINTLMGGHTHTHTHTYQHANQSNFKKTGVRGLWMRMPCLKSSQMTKYNSGLCVLPMFTNLLQYNETNSLIAKI